MDKKKFNADVDLYELLGVLPSSSVQEIKKAYRKKALTCHPDKNPDNPKAAELFHELANALEILIDESARAAYDRVLNGKKAAQLRHRELDAKRKKFKEDLEAREQAAKDATAAKRGYASVSDEERLQAEIARLRKEGSRMLAEEMELMKEELKQEAERAKTTVQYRLRLKWSVSKTDSTNGGYTYNNLFETLKKYGDVVALVISPKKQGSALVEFSSREAAENALRSEKGFASCPLTIETIGWTSVLSRFTESSKPSFFDKANNQRPAFSCFPGATSQSAPQTSFTPNEERDDSDFELMVLRRLREAQEKKNLQSDSK